MDEKDRKSGAEFSEIGFGKESGFGSSGGFDKAGFDDKPGFDSLDGKTGFDDLDTPSFKRSGEDFSAFREEKEDFFSEERFDLPTREEFLEGLGVRAEQSKKSAEEKRAAAKEWFDDRENAAKEWFQNREKVAGEWLKQAGTPASVGIGKEKTTGQGFDERNFMGNTEGENALFADEEEKTSAFSSGGSDGGFSGFSEEGGTPEEVPGGYAQKSTSEMPAGNPAQHPAGNPVQNPVQEPVQKRHSHAMLDEHALHSHTVLSEEEIAALTSPDGKIYMTVPPPRLRVDEIADRKKYIKEKFALCGEQSGDDGKRKKNCIVLLFVGIIVVALSFLMLNAGNPIEFVFMMAGGSCFVIVGLMRMKKGKDVRDEYFLVSPFAVGKAFVAEGRCALVVHFSVNGVQWSAQTVSMSAREVDRFISAFLRGKLVAACRADANGTYQAVVLEA